MAYPKKELWAETCVYCGEFATTKDHVTAPRNPGGSWKTVPACLECNVALGNRIRIDVSGGAAILIDHYIDKLIKARVKYNNYPLNRQERKLEPFKRQLEHIRKVAGY